MLMYSFWLICLFVILYTEFVLLIEVDTIIAVSVIIPLILSMLGVGAFIQVLIFLVAYLFFTLLVLFLDLYFENKD